MNKYVYLLPLFAIAAIAMLNVISEEADATTTCHATGNWCQGYAHVSTTTGGVASARCFAWRTTNNAPTCSTTGITPVNEGSWEVIAGQCITLYYFDTTTGAVPPAAPNKVSLLMRGDNGGTGFNGVQTLGPEPANGSSYSFCSTSDGHNTGVARAGTFRILINAVKDNGAGGVGNYNIDSDGGATVGANVGFDKGAIRGQILVSSIARSAYPAGSTFAYGSASDEIITITGTFTQPNIDANVETLRTCIADSGSLSCAQIGASTDIDAATTLAQTYVSDNTFPNAAYVPDLLIGSSPGCNAVLTGLPWTIFAATGHGANIVRISDTSVYDSTTFNIDSRIKLDSDGAGTFATADETDVTKLDTSSGALTELFNKGETVYSEWYIFNARSELLSRSMSYIRRDSALSTCDSIGSLSPTSNKYSHIDTLATSGVCLAAADTTGSTRHYLVTNTDQSYVSGTVFFVSSLLRLDKDGTGTPDNLMITCYGASGCPANVATVFNRQERVDCEGYIINARGSQYQVTSVNFKSFDSSNAQNNAQTISHSSGKYNCADFLLGSTEKATADTTGDPHYFTIDHNGNSGTSLSNNYGVSSLYFLDAHIQLSGTLNKDNFPTENANEDTAYIISTAQTDTTHGWCHVVGVRKDVQIDTSGNAITRHYDDPLSVNRFNQLTDTDSLGWTTTSLDLLASTPLGTWNFVCEVSFNGNTGTNSQAFTVSVPSSAGTGFPGDPLRIWCSPVIANPGETLKCVAAESNLDGSVRTGNAAHTFVSLYDPSNSAVVTGQSVTEISPYGQYYYSRAWGSSPTLGSYIVVVYTDDTPIVASSTIVVVETDPTLALATSTQVTGVATQVSGVATQVTGVATQVSGVATQVSGVATQLSGVATQVSGVQTSANTIIANQAIAATQVSGVATQVSGVQTSVNTVIANQGTAATQVSGVATQVSGVASQVSGVSTQVSGVQTSVNTLSTNNTNYHDHLNYHLHNVNTTIGNLTVNNTEVLNELREHRERSFEFNMEVTLLLFAIAFFVVMAETKNDALYWFLATVLSIYLLINRDDTSVVPVSVYVGWIFVTLYQAVSLLMTKRAQNLSSTVEE